MFRNQFDEDGWNIHRIHDPASETVEIVPIFERTESQQATVLSSPDILAPGPVNVGPINRHIKQINRLSQGIRDAARRSLFAMSERNMPLLQDVKDEVQNPAAQSYSGSMESDVKRNLQPGSEELACKYESYCSKVAFCNECASVHTKDFSGNVYMRGGGETHMTAPANNALGSDSSIPTELPYKQTKPLYGGDSVHENFNLQPSKSKISRLTIKENLKGHESISTVSYNFEPTSTCFKVPPDEKQSLKLAKKHPTLPSAASNSGLQCQEISENLEGAADVAKLRNTNSKPILLSDSQLLQQYQLDLRRISTEGLPERSSNRNSGLPLPPPLPLPRTLTLEELPRPRYSLYEPTSRVRPVQISTPTGLTTGTIAQLHDYHKQTNEEHHLDINQPSSLQVPSSSHQAFIEASASANDPCAVQKLAPKTLLLPQTPTHSIPDATKYYMKRIHGRYGLNPIVEIVNSHGVSQFSHETMDVPGDLIDFTKEWELVCRFEPYSKPLPLVDWVKDGPNPRNPVHKWTPGDQRLFPSKPMNLLAPCGNDEDENVPHALIGSYLTHKRPSDQEESEKRPSLVSSVDLDFGLQLHRQVAKLEKVRNGNKHSQRTLGEYSVDPFARNNPFAVSEHTEGRNSSAEVGQGSLRSTGKENPGKIHYLGKTSGTPSSSTSSIDHNQDGGPNFKVSGDYHRELNAPM